MNVRLASQADWPQICEVIKAVYDEYGFAWDPEGYHADLYDIDAYYFSQGDLFWVAEVDNKIVGTAALEFFDKVEGEYGQIVDTGARLPRLGAADCSFERLYVHPSARKGGVGSMLVETVLKEARGKGRTCIELWSDKRFGDAHRLYRRFGAEVVAERICDDPDVSPEWGLLIRL